MLNNVSFGPMTDKRGISSLQNTETKAWALPTGSRSSDLFRIVYQDVGRITARRPTATNLYAFAQRKTCRLTIH